MKKAIRRKYYSNKEVEVPAQNNENEKLEVIEEPVVKVSRRKKKEAND